VPPVFRRLETAAIPFILTQQLRQDVLSGAGEKRVEWGIFDDEGNLAIEPDNIVAVEPGREFRISDYPLEAGAFESYNKVATPGTVRVTMSKGGSDADRNEFLTTLDILIASLDPYNVITPEIAFLAHTLVRVDYQRSAQQGAKLLIVETVWQEIRETATAAFTNSKSPSGAAEVNAGPVQPATPTPTQQPTNGVASQWT
jgi:hypothetical protein